MVQWGHKDNVMHPNKDSSQTNKGDKYLPT